MEQYKNKQYTEQHKNTWNNKKINNTQNNTKIHGTIQKLHLKFRLFYQILKFVFTCKVNVLNGVATTYCLIFTPFYITLRTVL
jgi:hypothetical protein